MQNTKYKKAKRYVLFHIYKEPNLIIWRNDVKTKQYRKRHKNNAPPQSMLQWPWTCDTISFCQTSKMNSPYLPITYLRTIFMAWVLMVLQIIYVLFILGIYLKEIRVWTTLPISSFVLSITRGTILDHKLRTIRFLKLLLLLTTTVIRTRII